jgi:hypothetical protein
MPPTHIDFEILNDDVRWADQYDCFDLIVAGIWFLHETLVTRYPKCTLLERTLRLGNEFNALRKSTQNDPSKLTESQMSSLFSEMNTLGTLGYSLWHLKDCLDAPGLQHELKELSKLGWGQNSEGDSLRLRGQGFLLLAAANLAKQGFALEFIRRRKREKTPDFFALRDGRKFSCEVTSREPQRGNFDNLEFFWQTVNETVDRKKHQLNQPEFQDAVLIIDCTPVWETFSLEQIPIGGELVYFVPPELGGPRSGSKPIVRFDESLHSKGLQELQEIIRGTGIHTLILWKNRLELFDQGYKRHSAYRVIGTMDGITFLSYFEKALLFPGPNVQVNWS